jgi:hypothetical protein
VPLAGTAVTIRNPMAVWILGFVTLGIYTAISTYQVTRELRDYSRGVTRRSRRRRSWPRSWRRSGRSSRA